MSTNKKKIPCLTIHKDPVDYVISSINIQAVLPGLLEEACITQEQLEEVQLKWESDGATPAAEMLFKQIFQWGSNIERNPALVRVLHETGQQQLAEFIESKGKAQNQSSTQKGPFNEVDTVDEVSASDLGNFSDFVIGKGRYQVYKGTLNGADVAVKVGYVELQRQVRDMKNRIQSYGRISHPNVVPLLAYAVAEARLILAFELFTGVNLDKIIFEKEMKQYHDILNKNKLKIAKQLVSAVEYFHGLNPPFMHRNIRLSNILVNQNTMSVKLLGFGVGSTGLPLHEEMSFTEYGMQLFYTSPEVMLASEITTKCDIYSTGVTLLALFTKERCWDFEELPPFDIMDLVVEHLKKGIAPHALQKLGSEELKTCLAGCFSYDPTNRPTAQELYEVISRLADSEEDKKIDKAEGQKQQVD